MKLLFSIVFSLFAYAGMAQTHPVQGDSLSIQFGYQSDKTVQQEPYFVSIDIDSVTVATIGKVQLTFSEDAQSIVLLQKMVNGNFTSTYSDDLVSRSGGRLSLVIGFAKLMPIHYYKIELFDENLNSIHYYEGGID